MIIEEGRVYGISDTDRLDFLQKRMTGYGKGWVLRLSLSGRGLRLHETSRMSASPTVRKAIDLTIREMTLADYIEEQRG